jgi:hypothetical protein
MLRAIIVCCVGNEYNGNYKNNRVIQIAYAAQTQRQLSLVPPVKAGANSRIGWPCAGLFAFGLPRHTDQYRIFIHKMMF